MAAIEIELSETTILFSFVKYLLHCEDLAITMLSSWIVLLLGMLSMNSLAAADYLLIFTV